MKTKRHFVSVTLGLMVLLPLGAIYWWSGELVYIACCEGGPPSRREAAVKVCIPFPFLRKTSLLNVTASHFWSRGCGGMFQVLHGRYSEDALLDEVAAMWRSRLAAKKYFEAGIMLSLGHRISAGKFRTRVRQSEVNELIMGLGSGLDVFLNHYWKRLMFNCPSLASEVPANAPLEEDFLALYREQQIATALADLKAYHLN